MPLRCTIVDDNELDRLTLQDLLFAYDDAEIIGVFDNANTALKSEVLEQTDVVFLDIDMPGMSGIDFRKQVATIPICVFVTDHPEYAVESFELETLDYLVKPISEERFAATMARIREYIQIKFKASLFDNNTEDGVVQVKDGYQITRISLGDILYLNALQNYTSIVTENSKQYVLATLGNLLKENKFSLFKRIHKSYAVQKRYIKSISTSSVLLGNGVQLPVGRAYRHNLELLI